MGHLDTFRSSPNDDAGSETLARYDYQLTLAAMACLEMLLDEDAVEVICEWHEDYVVVRSRMVELVSVKHLEPSIGSWSLTRLLQEGGVKHLFKRWTECGETPSCRLQTNGGLRTGKENASAVGKACNGVDVERVAALLLPRLEAESLDQTKRFLSSLTINAELPKRDDLLPRLLVDSLPDLFERLGWPIRDIASRFERIRSLVARAAGSDIRAAGRVPHGPNDSAVAIARAQARKTITKQGLIAAMERIDVSEPSRLTTKLEAGGFAPTDVERCKRLRSEWLSLAYRWDPGLPGESSPDVVGAKVQDLACAAEDQARNDVAPYGATMRSQFIALVANGEIVLGGQALSENLLLGAVYEQTDRCRVWWSPRSAVEGIVPP